MADKNKEILSILEDVMNEAVAKKPQQKAPQNKHTWKDEINKRTQEQDNEDSSHDDDIVEQAAEEYMDAVLKMLGPIKKQIMKEKKQILQVVLAKYKKNKNFDTNAFENYIDDAVESSFSEKASDLSLLDLVLADQLD